MLLFGVATLLLSTSSFRSLLQDLFAFGATVFADQAVLTVAVVAALASMCGLSLIIRALTAARASAGGAKKEMTIAEKEQAIFESADEAQVQMMAEEVILLNDNDEVLGHASKKDTHLWSNIKGPDGLLHRAFSVFIFNKKGELMMQKRAAEKITFPSFWANSCCSHPLFTPTELDGVSGAKNAARRKILQELGIEPELLPLESFHFLTRVHYKAQSDEIWGEHEIDYIFICTPPEDVEAIPNPNEVAEARYFSKTALDTFVREADANGDLVSPWFRVIHADLLPQWWAAWSNGQLESCTDLHNIHRVGDAPNTDVDGFYSGAGGAGTGADTARVGDVSLKQGSYGKVPIYKGSTLSQLAHVDECVAMLRYKFGAGLGDGPITGSPDLDFCDEILGKVSRSFASVIRQLPDNLRTEICVFYLVLRALDTIEDDVTAFASHDEKIQHLLAFTANMQDVNWSMTGCGEGDERRLLEQYQAVARVFNTLDVGAQEVIADICDRMARGMAEFVAKDCGAGTATVQEYELYCHYVAGLVGEGLSRLFAYTGYESEQVGKDCHTSNSMGLFLQKVNITRDLIEDLVDGRTFYPKEIWSQYVRDLADMRLPQHREQALACLNHMVLNALEHVPDSLEYMSRLRDPQVFRFCAIPQIMAIATLSELYNNPLVLSGVVKIRKGLSCKIIQDCSSMDAVHRWFSTFARRIAARVPASDPNAKETLAALARVQELCAVKSSLSTGVAGTVANVLAPTTFVLLGAHLMARSKGRETFLPRLNETYDVTVVALMVLSVVYLFAFSGIAMAVPSASKADPVMKGAASAAPASARKTVSS